MSAIDVAAVVLAGSAFLSMGFFVVVSRSLPLDPDVANRGTTILLGRWVRDWLMWVIGPLERAMVTARVSPDGLNIMGALFGLAAGAAFAAGSFSAAGWLILLGGAADVFDGRIARARGIASAYGAFLDSTLDRFSESFAFLGLVLFFAPGRTLAAAAAAAMSGSLLVSYARARGEALGVSIKGGLMQRAERLVLLALAAIADPLAASTLHWRPAAVLGGAVMVIAAGTWGTAFWRLVSIASALKTNPPDSASR
ncbi:MAG TPA: CDP-alcohol phosphatidyltransferase family protein [Gemmatimonadaceae bacterium]|nr:CDP-alcohol phosphatidyltransferase family protein [Gemmatimonadaceae bacterium]